MVLRMICSLLLAFFAGEGLAAIVVKDDSDREVILEEPAKRIVSLAPHITETLFAIGAGDRIVGTVDYSDYPPEAKLLPRIGGYHRLDLEAIIALKPDLVVGWASGNRADELAKLEQLGFPLFRSEPRRIEDIAYGMKRLGLLSGANENAASASRDFRQQMERLDRHYGQHPRVSVFYEIWPRPLMTINGDHIISNVLQLCGGENIFSDLPALAPQVSEEAVLAADPEVIMTGGMGDENHSWLEHWRQRGGMTAVNRGNLFILPPDLIQRAGPRILEGAKLICEMLEVARSRR